MDIRYLGHIQGGQVTIQFVPSGETFDAWEDAIAHQDWLQQMEDLWESGTDYNETQGGATWK